MEELSEETTIKQSKSVFEKIGKIFHRAMNNQNYGISFNDCCIMAEEHVVCNTSVFS